jgi:hypothetical protein
VRHLHQEGHVGTISNDQVDVFTRLIGLCGRTDKHLSILNINKRRPNINPKDEYGDFCLLFVAVFNIYICSEK